ncbi:MAG: FAD-dependent oxidoreductase [Acidobacteria bacterium]|nr:FAD-dependent oxidoreductase [Acidobacteriota bacterium]
MGGQLTAGGVSALDEHKFIEFTGATRTYYDLRRRLRDHYCKTYQLTPAAAALDNFNPGNCYVSSLCFEPKVGVRVLDDMLAPHPEKVRYFPRTQVFQLAVEGGRITSALAYRFDTRTVVRLRPRWVLDATETGDLLPLAGVPYVVGSEARRDTGEPRAATEAKPACVQSSTYTFAIDVNRSGAPHCTPRPEGYERIRDSQPFSLRITYNPEYGWRGPFQYKMFGEDPPVPNKMSPGPFFNWRRLVAAANYTGANAPRGYLALMNWPRQDYHDESILDRTPADLARILQAAKRVSLAFMHWLQTDLARDDGQGNGYPELRLRGEVMGSEDGLSKYPYIRESRRLIPRAGARVVEQDIGAEYPAGSRAKWQSDSVGTGFYMVDIHPCGANEKGRMMMPRPFQLPMNTLVPQKVVNLLAAGKNIGVTHLTNGAFRLHPIEWNAGESAAVMASLAMARGGALPEAADLQPVLAAAGVPLVWFDDLRIDHLDFAAIHLAAIRGVYPLSAQDLHASPDAPMTRREAAAALAKHYGISTADPQQLATAREWMAVDHRNWFHPDLPLYWTDIREATLPSPLPVVKMKRTGPVTRAEFARRLIAKQ